MFSFPVTLSKHLDRLAVLSSIVSVCYTPTSTLREPRYEYMVQTLDRVRSSGLNTNRNRQTAYSMFSPSSKALALVSISTPLKGSKCENVQIEVWSDVAACGYWPRYEFRGEVNATRKKSLSTANPPLDLVAFHENDQVLFFKEVHTTTAWRFDEQGKSGGHLYDLMSQAYI
jgi:hypothetical protein